MRKLILASQNQAKLREMRDLLEGLPFEILASKEAGFVTEIEETGDSFAANACIKAETLSQALHNWSLADDSGLVVDFLNGAPGVYSARYAGEKTDDAANNAKLLNELRDIPQESRKARFVSVIALARPGVETICFEGVCEGEILEEPRGLGGFGYDPLFLPDGETQSFAELSARDKNELSHRGKAMQLLRQYLLTVDDEG